MAVHAAKLTQKVLLSELKHKNVAVSLFLKLLIIYFTSEMHTAERILIENSE